MQEHNSDVHWVWPTKVRLGNGREEEMEKYRFTPGDPRPDFMCVGAQKAGTTWLYQQLHSHPDFWMPPVKELEYFTRFSRTKAPPRPRDDRDSCFLERMKCLSAKAYIDLENYARLFEPKGSLLCGDVSPTYSMLNDEIIQRIVDYFPSLKVIFLARDPVERVWSQLSMGVRLGKITTFDVNDVDEVIQNLLSPGVFRLSFPSTIAARWRRHVPPDQFRVYLFDDLEENPAELRRSILDFLGADTEKVNGKFGAGQNAEAGTKKLKLSDKVRSHLAQFFKKELKACAAEFGGSAIKWPTRYGFSLLWLLVGVADKLNLFLWADWTV